MKKILLCFAFIILLVDISIAQTNESDKINMSMPENEWCISIDMPKLQISGAGISPSGSSRNWKFEDKEVGILMTVFFEKAPKKGTSLDCRDYYYSRTKMAGIIDMETVKFFQKNDFECVEYFYTDKGKRTDTKSYNVYYSRDDIWVDIHFSKTKYVPSDSIIINGILNGITVDNSYKDAVLDCYAFGSIYYYAHKYDIAKPFYEQALIVERKKHRLERDLKIALIDNLGMSYGMTADFDKAISTFEYGQSVEPTYPGFYFNNACTYAEKGDMDKAIDNLKLAGKNKNNGIKGERIPDPMTDDSFKKYVTNEKFLKAVEEYNK